MSKKTTKTIKTGTRVNYTKTTPTGFTLSRDGVIVAKVNATTYAMRWDEDNNVYSADVQYLTVLPK